MFFRWLLGSFFLLSRKRKGEFFLCVPIAGAGKGAQTIGFFHFVLFLFPPFHPHCQQKGTTERRAQPNWKKRERKDQKKKKRLRKRERERKSCLLTWRFSSRRERDGCWTAKENRVNISYSFSFCFSRSFFSLSRRFFRYFFLCVARVDEFYWIFDRVLPGFTGRSVYRVSTRSRTEKQEESVRKSKQSQKVLTRFPLTCR